MRSLSLAAATIASSIILGCTMQASAERKMGQNSLKGDALRTLLSDAYVEPVRPAGGVIVSHWPGEIFQSNGIYVRIPNRTRMYGTFDIRGNVVCVEGDGFRRQCRRVLSLNNGTYSFIDVADGSATIMTITRH